MQKFPSIDMSDKPFDFFKGDREGDMKDAYNNEPDAQLFRFDDDQGTRINFQPLFLENMSRAIERLVVQKRAKQIEEAEQEYMAAHRDFNDENENEDEDEDEDDSKESEGGRRRNATRRRQKGGGVDEILFETLYTLYVYRAQYDIELDTHDRSINLDVLCELYEDYPKSEIQPNRNNTLRRVKGGPVTEAPMHTYTIPVSQVTGGPVTRRLATGMSSANMRKQAIARYAQTHKRVRNNYNPIYGEPISGGRITRRKKKHHRRTRK
jgi:hypothetical protein